MPKKQSSGFNIPALDQLHKRLSKKSKWYAQRGTISQTHVIQWAVLMIIVASITGLFVFRSQVPVNPSLSEAAALWNQRSAELENLTSQMIDKSAGIAKADELTKQRLANEVKGLAYQRHDLMKLALHEGRIDIFLKHALDSSETKKLSPEAAALVESEETNRGEYIWVIADSENGSQEQVSIKVNDKIYQLLFDKGVDWPTALSGDTVTVEGFRFEDKIIVAPDEDIIVNRPGSTSSINNPKVGVIIFNFANTGQVPLSPDQVRSKIFGADPSVKNYISEFTGGQKNITSHLSSSGDVFGPYNLPINYVQSDCAPLFSGISQGHPWILAAEQAASANGFIADNYDHIIYFVPDSCGWYGIADVPGKRSINFKQYSLQVIAHELGHNWGMGHSGVLYCTGANGERVAFSNNCTTNYPTNDWDPDTVMGRGYQNGVSHPSMSEKSSGHGGTDAWSTDLQTLNSTNNQDGTYTLVPANSQAAGTKGLRVTFGTGGNQSYDSFYLEYRQPSTYENSSATAFYSGIAIRYGGLPGGHTQLVDTNPAEDYNHEDAPLGVGRTFFDPVHNITIRTESLNSTSATVRVTYGQVNNCVQNNPFTNLDTATQPAYSGPAGTTFTYTAQFRNNDSPDCSPATFTLTPTQLLPGWTTSTSPYTVTIEPGMTVNRAFTFTSPTNATVGNNFFTYMRMERQGTPTSFHTQGWQFVITTPCPATVPTVTVTPAQHEAEPNVSKTYNVTVRNNDVGGAGCPSRQFLIGTNSLPSGWVAPANNTQTLSSGMQVTVPMAIKAPQGTASGLYPIGFRALVLNTSPPVGGTASAEFRVLGPTSVEGPVIYITSPAEGYQLSANGSMPVNVGVEVVGGIIESIEVKRDNEVIKTCTELVFGYGECNTTVSGTSMKAGNHKITVTAREFGTGQTATSSVNFIKLTPSGSPR